MWGVAIVRSGEEGLALEGSRVGESSLSSTRSLSVSACRIKSPRASARLSSVWEYQAGLWALKSPRMMLSSGGEKSPSRCGVKLAGHEVTGGMYML